MKRSDIPSPLGPPRPGAPDERLDAWLDGDLGAPEADAVAHLVATDAAWAEAAETARELAGALASAPVCRAPEGFRARVVAQAARTARPAQIGDDRPARPPARRTARAAWRGVMATVLLLVLVAVAARVGRPDWNVPPTAEPAPTAAEVARAQREVAWTLAYLSAVGEKAAEGVRDEAFTPPADAR